MVSIDLRTTRILEYECEYLHQQSYRLICTIGISKVYLFTESESRIETHIPNIIFLNYLKIIVI